jgi:hypothetical protein
MTWEELKDLKEDQPRLMENYIVEHNVTRSTRNDRTMTWAKKVIRDLKRTSRWISRLYNTFVDENDEVYQVRRIQNRKKKRRKFSLKASTYKYVVQVPRNVRNAFELDKANDNLHWADTIKAEMKDLFNLEAFDIRSVGYNPGPTFQSTTLTIVFDVKQDLRRKARLVARGHLVNPMDHSVYSSTVKGISVNLLHVIAHKAKLEQLCGDVSLTFVNTYTLEKVYAITGPEFGEQEGKPIVILKALYGLCMSSERWHSHFADTLRTLGFKQTRFDNNVWSKLNDAGTDYDYTCTHVDDFMIWAKDPKEIMDRIEKFYTIKDIRPPRYYLGNNYKKDRKGRWCIGCNK